MQSQQFDQRFVPLQWWALRWERLVVGLDSVWVRIWVKDLALELELLAVRLELVWVRIWVQGWVLESEPLGVGLDLVWAPKPQNPIIYF